MCCIQRFLKNDTFIIHFTEFNFIQFTFLFALWRKKIFYYIIEISGIIKIFTNYQRL